MDVNVDNIISVTEAGNNVSRYLNEAASGRTIVVIKNSQPFAAIVGLDAVKRLSHIAEAEENLRLWTLALVRSVSDNGERFDLDEVAREFGVDLDEDPED